MAEPRYNTYIGARYIPLFCGDWDNTLEYEPLSIVSYEGNSYTSRTFVPAGVAITNTDYWFVSGNYNQQVESYRREVVQYKEDLEEDMSNIEAKVDPLEKAQIQIGVTTQYKSLDIMCNALWSVLSIMQRGETLDINNTSSDVNIYVQGDTIYIESEVN